MASLAAVALYAATAGGVLAIAGESIAAGGAVVLAAGIALRTPFVVPWSVALAGAGYVVARERHAVADGWAPLVGAALLLAAELAAWSIAHDRRIDEERAVVLRQAATVAAVVLGAAFVGFVLVGAAGISSSPGALPIVLGAAAAVAAVGLVGKLLRQ
ncbi:MAG TPA: hypothetical protein VFA97_00215 [Gaiellaceae bacterium]|nr:hypothetical protein [Gaiellaceae bacterium]